MAVELNDTEELGDIIQSKIDRIVDSNRHIYDEKVEQYVENGTELDTAEQQANNEMLQYNRNKWLDQYTNTLINIEHMKRNDIHQSIRKSIQKYVNEKDYGITEAIKSAVNKRKFGFDKLIRPYDSEDDNMSGDDEDDQIS